MLQVSSLNRIDLTSALSVVSRLKKGQRRVFENEESDIKYSKFVQKTQIQHQKSNGGDFAQQLQRNTVLSEFYSAILKQDRAFSINQEILDYL